MKVHILGEVHPEVGLLFIVRKSRDLEALRATIEGIGKEKADKVLEKRIDLIKKIIREFERHTKDSITAIQEIKAELYLVEGAEKIELENLIAISKGTEKERDESLEKETTELCQAYEIYASSYARQYEPFEYKLPRKATSVLDLPGKPLMLLRLLEGKEAIERKIAKKIASATAPLKHKIRELPAAANILKKLKAHKQEKVMIITGLTHVPVYEKILKIAGHEIVNVTKAKKGCVKRLVKAMERTEIMFEIKSLEADLKKTGISGKDAKRLAKNFRYTRAMLKINRET